MNRSESQSGTPKKKDGNSVLQPDNEEDLATEPEAVPVDTPLLGGDRVGEASAASVGYSVLKFVGGAGKTAAKKVRVFALQEYSKLKNDPKRGPIVLLWLSCASSVCLLITVALDFVAQALTFSPVEALSSIYAFATTALVLAAETARVSPSYGIRSFLHFYFGFIEFSVGLGAAQLLVASLVLTQPVLGLLSTIKLIPASTIFVCGAVNIIWGTYAAYKLNVFLKKLKEHEVGGTEGEDKQDTMTARLNIWDRKFEALNKRGDGRLSKDDIREGITDLNLSIDELELAMIFNSLDVDKDGYVSKEEFEEWWLTKMGTNFL